MIKLWDFTLVDTCIIGLANISKFLTLHSLTNNNNNQLEIEKQLSPQQFLLIKGA